MTFDIEQMENEVIATLKVALKDFNIAVESGIFPDSEEESVEVEKRAKEGLNGLVLTAWSGEYPKDGYNSEERTIGNDQWFTVLAIAKTVGGEHGIKKLYAKIKNALWQKDYDIMTGTITRGTKENGNLAIAIITFTKNYMYNG